MSKKTIIQLVLLTLFTITLSGCSSLRGKLQNKINSTATESQTTTTGNTPTTETYDSVQKVRAASSEKEAVSVTTTEVDAAFKAADAAGDADTLNTTDIGL